MKLFQNMPIKIGRFSDKPFNFVIVNFIVLEQKLFFEEKKPNASVSGYSQKDMGNDVQVGQLEPAATQLRLQQQKVRC
jgi:hypothetical protein